MPAAVQQARELFRFVDRARADQHRPAGGVQLAHFVDDRLPFVVGGAETCVRQPLRESAAGCVGIGTTLQLVDLAQLAGRSGGGARHAGQARVAQEIILNVTRAAWPVATVTSTPSLASTA